ncbi:MAG: flagellar motor switch protein FliM [Candidatus Binatia bacterium]|nr:flagellar motor switch protein FliM [Candidatus Binatia bacterium]
MDSTLSQDEVDALLKGMQDGDVAIEDKPPCDAPRPYNLVGEERAAGRQFPGLELVHDRFVRRLRKSLSHVLGSSAEIEITNVEVLRYGRFRNRIEPGASLSLFSMAPLSGNGLLVLGPSLMSQLVDRMFGGQGRPPTTLEIGEYSPIELQVVSRVASTVLADLQDAWSLVAELSCSFLRTEVNAAIVSIAATEDMVLAVDLQCDLGGGPTKLTLTLPAAMLEPLRARLGESHSIPADADNGWLNSLIGAIQQTDVDLSVELGTNTLSARELLRLEVGDVLPLPTRGDDHVSVLVEGQPVMTGLAGTNRGRHVVRILSFTQET